MISQTTEYALRAVVWLACHPGQPLTARQIAEASRVPAGYLAKVLQGLGRAGLLRSMRGLGGGFSLARSASKLSVWDVIQAVDPIKRICECPLGLEPHNDKLCALHQELDNAIARLEKQFSRCSLASLVADTSETAPLCAFTPRPKAQRRGGKRAKR